MKQAERPQMTLLNDGAKVAQGRRN